MEDLLNAGSAIRANKVPARTRSPASATGTSSVASVSVASKMRRKVSCSVSSIGVRRFWFQLKWLGQPNISRRGTYLKLLSAGFPLELARCRIEALESALLEYKAHLFFFSRIQPNFRQSVEFTPRPLP